MRRWCVVMLGSSLLWVIPFGGCSVDSKKYDFQGDADAGSSGVTGGASGSLGSLGTGGTAGKSSGGAGGGPSFGGNTIGAANGGEGTGPEGTGGLSTGDSGSTEPGATGGSEGEPEPPMGDCEADQVEDCGDCGQRHCDSATLTWGDCIGDGSQRNCWETDDGDPLPGTMPEEPKGKCTVGVQTCQADGNWDACTGAVAPKPSDDCDVAGDDSDCSGSPNDGCNCSPGAKRDCGS
ncbi:MAG: hypothetical protein M3020_23465, partial [Myxococcota bacterium]|nr:hypothetical protein [Myxococcota bacterium]